MKEEVKELYREGLTAKEIATETGLAYSTVEVYIYQSGINKDPDNRRTHLRVKIKKLIAEYEKEFGEPLVINQM